MATQSFNCPNCGAPLEYHDGDPSTIRCPFCSTSVIVPQELRPAQPPAELVFSFPVDSTPRTPAKRASCLPAIIIAAVVVVILAAVLIPLFATQQATSAIDSITGQVNQMSTQALSIVTAAARPTHAPAPTPTRAASPTPSFARAALQFGKQGIGPGLLNDARNITVDGKGTLYIADYQGGRVQAFDSTGKYLSQWKVGGKNTIIEGLAATLKGEVYVSADGYVYGVDGATGKQLSKWSNPNGGEYGDLAITPEGNLATAWYEGRWGMITTLEGHRDDLVVLNPQGKEVLRVPSFISNQTGALALDNFITVDGKGNFYVLSGGTIYKFGPDGKYINSFGSTGSAPDQFNYPTSLAVDGLGRLFVGDSRKVLVFSPDGRFIDSFATEVTPSQMAIDLKSNVWIISGEKVSEFVMIEN